MNENSKATQTWDGVDVARIPVPSQRCHRIPLSKVALLSYRCLLAAGIISTIIIMMNLDHKQFRLLNIMYQHDATRSMNSNGSESLNHSITHSPSNHSGDHSSAYFVQYQTVFKYMVPLEDLHKDYVVYNPSCEIPNYPKFHKDVKRFFRKEKEVNCTSKPQLTSVTRSAGNSTYVLNLHKRYLPHYQVNPLNDLVCCYSIIITDNDNHKVHECEIFDTHVKLNSSADAVRVTCEDNTTPVYETVHFLIPIKPQVRHKIEKHNVNHTSEEPLSVLIVGIDAVSRLNLLRTMPETIKYVEKKGWFALEGYHKIEKNTFFNLNGPVLTGHSAHQLRETCWPKVGSPFDSCPWIWKGFSEKNYITAYGEDGPNYDSFNYYGEFKKQPMDYFLRPLMKVTHELNVGNPSDWYPMCIGSKRAADYILDFSADFASRFVNQPTFSLIWLNSLGHVNMNYPEMVDKKFVSYLDTLDRSGALNRSMVVFMSDHGFQSWEFRQTQMGFVEDSMPFLYLWLPKWYREKYPNKAVNLAGNRNRLTSHFDLYLTLMDVLGVNAKAAGCPKCVSLFDPVPWNRGCADAGIAEESCTCKRYEEIPTNSTVVKQLGLLVAAYMNNILTKYSEYVEEGYRCATIKIKSIMLARREIVKRPNSDGQLYVIHVATSPGNGISEAVIQLHTLEVKSIINYSYYEPRSYCMKSRLAKAWCTCQSLFTSTTLSPRTSY